MSKNPPEYPDKPSTSEAVVNVTIEGEIKSSYLGYAMSVIVGRALPDVRDGLKPVQRRILYAMHELGNSAQNPHKKSARIVGDVLGKYHPHGEAPVYEALVRMAQKFSLRYTLVDGHGNFGSVDGDPAAHMRYTEVRLTPIAQALLKDLDRKTVNFSPNYDGCEEMPDILPAALPNLLVNGSTGIAVGMATNIPPHNLAEVLNACLAYIDAPGISIEELLEHLPGPDFPTAAIIHGTEGILEAYRTGKGRVILRSRAEVQTKGEKEQIVVTEIPYQVNKSRLLESIAALVKEKKIEGISDLRDESDRTGVRIVIEIKRGAVGEVILNHLYQQTALQTTFSVNMVVVSEGRPLRMNLKEMIEAFIRHRRMVVLRRTQRDHDQLQARLHILSGLIFSLHFLDHCIALIRASDSPAQAKTALMETDWRKLFSQLSLEDQENIRKTIDPSSFFSMSAELASAILALTLHRLTGLEVNKLSQEVKQARAEVERLQSILQDPLELTKVVRSELAALKAFSDPRKTEIQAAFSLEDEDFIANETVVVTFSQKGYIKYQPLSEYGAQRRGGRGKSAASLRTEDIGEGCLVVNTHDQLLCFSSKGRVYWLKVYQLPRASRTAKGRPIINLLPLIGEERITTLLPVPKGSNNQYVVLATTLGTLKKIQLSDLQTGRSAGIIACKLQEGDTLVGAEFTQGDDDILMFSARGKVVRFSEHQVRAMGRNAGGVRGIQLDPNDRVVSLCIPSSGGSILTVTQNGYGKRTAVKEYPVKSRATKGVISIKVNERNGPVVGALQVNDRDEIVLLTQNGILLRLRAQEVSHIGRNTQGVTLVRLEDLDQVVGVQKLLNSEEVALLSQDVVGAFEE